jgi:hypothetical protein
MTMEIDRKILLDTKAIAQQLIPMLAEIRPTPSVESVNRFINLAFFASLEQEEGRPVRFALALVDDHMLTGSGANTHHWRPIPFSKYRLASLHTLVKLAPAVDHRQTFVAIVERDGDLYIAGLIRTNMEYYRISRGDTESAGMAGYKPLIARALDTGSVTLDIGYSHAFTITRGVLLPEGINVFTGGFVFDLICKYARTAGLDIPAYYKLLRGTILRLANRGHGGTVVILSSHDYTLIDFRFDMNLPSAALQDVIRFANDKNLELNLYRIRKDISNEATVRQTKDCVIQQYDFMQDGCEFAADLASVDGALVLNADLSIVGFGGHLLYSDPANVPVVRALNQKGSETGQATLESYGTRHNSAARFCWNRPGATAFVVSQDGVVSCFHRVAGSSQLLMWRPVALETHSRATPA